jgi:hypothetical protein
MPAILGRGLKQALVDARNRSSACVRVRVEGCNRLIRQPAWSSKLKHGFASCAASQLSEERRVLPTRAIGRISDLEILVPPGL